MKHAFERMGRRAVSLLMVVCLMLGMVGTAFAASKEDIAEDAYNTVVKENTIKQNVEAVQAGAAYVVAEYENIYATAYAITEALGYIGVAIDALNVAAGSMDTASAFVDGYELPAELAGVKAEMLEELTNTKATLVKLAGVLETEDLSTVDALVAEVLELEVELWIHLDTLQDLAVEAGIVIDPYLVDLNNAVEAYAAMAAAMADQVAAEIAACEAAYAAWVEEVGALADAIDPALGAAVRKFLTETPADTMDILAEYAEAGVAKLFADAAVAYGDVADVIVLLANTLYTYGEEIYAAVETNPEVEALVTEIKAQLEVAEEIAESLYNDTAENALNRVYPQLVVLYNDVLPVVLAAIAEEDETAALALEAALDALTEVLAITCDAAEGYLGWLANHTEAMGAALLAALLENVDELVSVACSVFDQLIWNLIAQIEAAIPGIIEYLVDELIAFLPVADQWMYNWLYTHPYEVIAFFTEYGDEIDALANEYGDEVVAILAYIAYTYGPEVLEFIIENPCEALDMFVNWYNKYGYRIWPMIDVYLEALGVYDAIEDAMNGELDKLNDLLNQINAEVMNQIAALQAQIAALKDALKDAEAEAREAILAEIAALEAAIEQLQEDLLAALKSYLQANISAKYVVGPNSYYVALGDAGAYGPAADLLAAELGMTNKYANLTIENATASVVLAALNAAEIAKADLITLGFGATPIIDSVVADVTNSAFGEVSEKDWAALVGEEGAAAIAAALVELGNYVMEQTGDEMVAAVLPVVVESFAYTYITHLVDYVVVSEAIHEINADALLVLVGMHNPLDGVVVDLEGEELDLGEYVDYLVTLTNVYSFGYALYAENTIYVDAPDVEVDAETMLPTEAGYVYIQEQIYNALNPTLAEEEEHVHTGTVIFTWAADNSTCKAEYVCSVCGLTETKDCLVEVEIVKQPTEEETGEAKYTASVEFFGKTYSESKTVELPKLGTPDTGDTTMVGLYVTVMLVAAAAAVVVLKKKKTA